MANTYLPNIISFWFIVIFGFLLIRRPWLKNLASILFASGILWLFMGSDHSLYVFVAVYTASSVFIFCNLYELGYGIVNRRLKRRLNVVPASMPGSGEALEALQKAIDHDACKILRGYTGFISKKEPLLCLTKDETSAAIRYRIPIGLATKKICQEGEYQGYYGYVFLPSEEMKEHLHLHPGYDVRASIYPMHYPMRMYQYLLKAMELESEAAFDGKNE